MKNTIGLENKKLVLFFTCGISLNTWERTGNLTREIKLYNDLAKYFKRIYFITYGRREKLKYKEKLAKNIEVLPKKISLPSRVYQFFIPLIYRKELKDSDIYKTNQMGAAIPAVLSKWFYKKKLIIRCGYEWLSILENSKKPFWQKKIVYFIEKFAYKTADRIILTSKWTKKYIEDKFKISSLKIEVIPNYVDIDLFKPHDIPKEKNLISFVGRLSLDKNLSNLIKAISDLKVKLVIFGNGPSKIHSEKLTKELGSKVEFRGSIPNTQLPEELNKSELFILPSSYECNPKALLEAMACGLPCIGTNVEGIREIILHKENGYICEIETESIEKAIMKVLVDINLRKKIGQNARKTILENFNYKKISEREMKIYESI